MPGPPLIYHACHTRGIHLQVLAARAVQSSIIYLSPNTSVLVRYVLCLSCSQLFKIMNLAPIDPRRLFQPATAEIRQLLGSFMQVRRVQEDFSSQIHKVGLKRGVLTLSSSSSSSPSSSSLFPQALEREPHPGAEGGESVGPGQQQRARRHHDQPSASVLPYVRIMCAGINESPSTA